MIWTKLKIAECKFWNSGKKMRFSGNDHTLLADAIMTGNVEIAKKLSPTQKLKVTPLLKTVLEKTTFEMIRTDEKPFSCVTCHV